MLCDEILLAIYHTEVRLKSIKSKGLLIDALLAHIRSTRTDMSAIHNLNDTASGLTTFITLLMTS